MRDPNQYARFSDERSLPFFTLLSRIPDRPFQRIVDLGCGNGALTRAIADRWPEAHVLGLDSSPQMLAGAGAYTIEGRLDFIEGDIAAYDQPADLLFSNAALQWLDDHDALFPRLAALVRPGGAFAVQMPDSSSQPSHQLLLETARNGPWTAKLADWSLRSVERLPWYIDLLMRHGFAVDAWETNYFFVLQGEDPVMEWVKGTSMQPILALLDETEQQQFCAEYAERLRVAYPPSAGGTVFPFRRIFFVATRD
jgi:trans-aconitate 2-methyltransferase